MKKCTAIFILGCVLLSVEAQGPATNRSTVTPALVNELAEEARRNNSGLLAAKSRVIAAQQNALSIPKWRDPEVMVGGMAAESMMRKEDGDVMYGVEQQLPVFGKEKAARKAAETEAGVAEETLDFQFQILRKELAEALFGAALADELLEISRQDLGWLQTLAMAVEERYQAGDASQLDLLRVQNDLSKQRDQFTTAELKRGDAYVTVNRILNRNVHSVWAPMALPDLAPPVYYSARLLDIATRFEPRLKVLRKEIESARAMVNLSRTEQRPDLGVGAEVRHYSRTGEARSGSVLLKLSFPWLNADKYRAAIRRDEARVQELENLLEDYHYELRAELHHLTSRADIARREALLYRNEIIPRSEAALESARAAWETNRDLFWDVLEARRILLEARGMYFQAVAEQWQTLSELVLCCGLGDLEALSMLTETASEEEANQPERIEREEEQ